MGIIIIIIIIISLGVFNSIRTHEKKFHINKQPRITNNDVFDDFPQIFD